MYSTRVSVAVGVCLRAMANAVIFATALAGVGCASCCDSAGTSRGDDLVPLGAFTYWPGWEREVHSRFAAAGVRPGMLGGAAGAEVWVPSSGLAAARAIWVDLQSQHPGHVIVALP